MSSPACPDGDDIALPKVLGPLMIVMAVALVRTRCAAADRTPSWRAAPIESLVVAPGPPSVTGALGLEEAFRLALQHHPDLSARLWSGRADVARAREEALTPNPTLEATLENFKGGLPPAREERTLILSQPLDLAGRRRALRRVTAALATQSAL